MSVNKLSWAERLSSPTPAFFKKIRKWGAILTTLSVIVLAANGMFALGLPMIVDTIGKFLGYGGFIAATMASFTVDGDALKEKQAKAEELSKGAGKSTDEPVEA